MPANATYKVSGYCQGARDQAAVLIFNNDIGGERVFTVRSLFVREAVSAPAVATTLYNVYRTTAQTGGEPIDVDPMSTAAAAIPSQVVLANYAVVTTGGYMHGRWLCPTGITNVGLQSPGGYSSGTSFLRSDTAAIFDHRGFADTQNVVLREGEGLAFYNPTSTDNPQPVTWHLQGTLKIGSDNYTFCTTLTPATYGLAGFGIFNGTGSGVVVEILALAIMNPGNPTVTTGPTVDTTSTRICRVFGYENVGGGEAVTPVSFGGAPVPSQLQVLVNREASPLHVGAYVLNPKNGVSVTDLGYPATMAIPLFRVIGTFRQTQNYLYNVITPGGASAGAFTSVFQGNGALGGPNVLSTDGSNGSTTGIRLNAGEGLAFIVNNPTLYSSYYFEAEITHEPAQVSGTAPMGYSS